MIKKLLAFALFCITNLTAAVQFSPASLSIKVGAKQPFMVKITPANNEYVYKTSLQVSSNDPHITVSWHIASQSQDVFDPQFNASKSVFKNPVTITGTLDISATTSQAHLVVAYQTNKLRAPAFITIPLVQPQSQPTAQTRTPAISTLPVQTQATDNVPVTCPAPHEQKTSLRDYIQHLFSHTGSLSVRLLLALLLGLLMSLTPCIYPMIPITIGILHAHSHRSWLYTAATGLSYTLGIACMYAVLGLSAAYTGALFGNLSSKPIVIITVIAILLYFALSLFGLYRIKLPSFLTKSRSQKPTGTLLSAFVFGIASGTIASPCLSPGLAFLLSIVASLASAIQGFFLLFAFGVGMSIPLLIIGTGSAALPLMPRVGPWMVEIQKIFGLLLIALCFYYLSNIVSLAILLWLIATTLLTVGLYYLFTNNAQTRTMRALVYALVLATIASAGLIYWQAINQTFYQTQRTQEINWQSDLQTARSVAQKENKPLLIDIGAPYCSVCKAIDHCIFADPYIASLLNRMICIKIDATSSSDYPALNKQFTVVGVPTILIINPHTNQVLQRWGSELYALERDEIGRQLNALL